MDYDAETIRKVRAALTQSVGLLYRMMPTDDGGESYEMQCTICGALGNILAKEFVHGDNCPVPIEEARLRAAK
jgi:hypothetical protein